MGDGDPLDICILSEKAFSHGDFLLQDLLDVKERARASARLL